MRTQFNNILDPIREHLESGTETGVPYSWLSLRKRLSSVHTAAKNIEESFMKKEIVGDWAFKQLCLVKHQCTTNCAAVVLHRPLLTVRNGESEVFGRPSLNEQRSKEIEQSVAVLFSSATPFTLSRFDYNHFMIECFQNRIKLVEM